MQPYKWNIVIQFVQTALISDDPEEYLLTSFDRIINYLDEGQLDKELETMFQEELQMLKKKMKILAYICAFVFVFFLAVEGETLKHVLIQFATITITGTYLVYYANRRTI
jgi:hypothetical protein